MDPNQQTQSIQPESPITQSNPLKLASNHKNKFLIIFFAFAVLIILLVGGNYLFLQNHPINKKQLIKQLSPSTKSKQQFRLECGSLPSNLESIANWTSFNSKIGYSIQYPSVLQAFDPFLGHERLSVDEISTVYIRSKDDDENSAGILIEGEDLREPQNYKYSSLGDLANLLLKSLKEDDSSLQIIKDAHQSNFMGISSYEYIVNTNYLEGLSSSFPTCADNIKTIIFQHNNKIWFIAYHSNSIFEKILATFQFK